MKRGMGPGKKEESATDCMKDTRSICVSDKIASTKRSYNNNNNNNNNG